MMQQIQRFRARVPGRFIFCAAWVSGAALGCNSDHYLGDLTPGLTDEGEGTGSAGGSQDFLVSPVLGPPDVSMDAGTEWSRNGYSDVTGVGDVDGDGFDDFASIGEDLTEGHRIDYVHIRYGGPRPQSFGDRFELMYGGARLGLGQGQPGIEAIVPAGDVDGDGFADFVVGLTRCERYEEVEGAYLVYGGPTRLDAIGDLSQLGVHLQRPFLVRPSPWRETPPELVPPRPDCSGRRHTGLFFAGVGDVDGDGFDDVMFSDTSPDTDGVSAYLFYGRAERLTSGTSMQSADARFIADEPVTLEPVGDINADGLDDVVLGTSSSEPTSFAWLLAGRAERLSGALEPASVATPFMPARRGGDLDGDGVSDILVYEGGRAPHLFYGAPGLFDAGVDLSEAAATFEPYAGQLTASVVAIDDRDGDGDDELVSRIVVQEELLIRDRESGRSHDLTRLLLPQEVAFLSGSSARRSGRVGLAAPSDPIGAPGYPRLENFYRVGDLDGDGASDLVTQTSEWSISEEGGIEAAGNWPTLHIHYGTPGGELASPPR